MLLIYLIVFLLFYITSNVGKRPTFKVILLIYLSAIVCACCLWFFVPDITRRYPLYRPAILYHVVVLVLMMLPLKRYDRIIAPEKISITYETLRPFFVGIIVLSLITILSAFVTYYLIFSSGVSILEGRTMSISGDSFVRIVKPHGSILSHISAIASEVSYLALFFAFLVAYKYPTHFRMFKWLLISSLAAIFHQLEWFGRENIVRFFLDGIIVLVIFWPLFSDIIKKKITKIILIFVIGFGIIFSYITIDRFGEGSGHDYGPIYSVFFYFGQGFLYYSPIYRAYDGLIGRTNGKTIFAAFYPDSERGSIFNLASTYMGSIDIPHNIFPTYVGSFVSDLGAIPALIPFALLIVFFLLVSKMKSDNIFTYIYILWIYRFFTQGVFYWIDTWNNGDRLLCFVLIIILNFIYNTHRAHKY